MINYIRGKLVHKTPQKVVVDIQGIGFGIWIPLSTYEKLPDIEHVIQLNTIRMVCQQVYQLRFSINI